MTSFLVAPVSARRVDVCQGDEIEFDNGAERVGRGATLLHGPAYRRPGPAERRRSRLDMTSDAHLAFQAEPGLPPPPSQAEAQDHELARV